MRSPWVVLVLYCTVVRVFVFPAFPNNANVISYHAMPCHAMHRHIHDQPASPCRRICRTGWDPGHFLFRYIVGFSLCPFLLLCFICSLFSLASFLPSFLPFFSRANQVLSFPLGPNLPLSLFSLLEFRLLVSLLASFRSRCLPNASRTHTRLHKRPRRINAISKPCHVTRGAQEKVGGGRVRRRTCSVAASTSLVTQATLRKPNRNSRCKDPPLVTFVPENRKTQSLSV